MGLKENVIVGRLIPAGTGAVMNRLKEIAAKRDKELQAPGGEGAITPALAGFEASPPPAE